VESFARQLGTAIETQRLRRQLERAAAERHARGQEMLDRGIDLLRLCPDCGRCFDQRAERCDADGAVLEAPRAFPYRLAGRYRLLQVRGEGGMATVYRAQDERLNRTVAVKVIKPELFHNAALRERFAHEARVAASIDHPGVVAVFDSGELEDESQFMVMEWLHGRDLGDLMKRRGAGSPQEVARLVRQAGAALGAAHAAGLIHRDIKPDNLFLVPAQEGFRVKIVDFGVAKELSAAPELTRTGALVGTPLYMSPEQFMGAALDTRTDLYSIAAVVFEALTGRRVTLSREFVDIVLDVVQGTTPSITSYLPDAPAAVDDLLIAALSKKPTDRPPDAVAWSTELALELERMVPIPARWLGRDGRLALDERQAPPLGNDPEARTVLSGQKA
jgi:serine/threonine protein kinase